MKKCIEYEYVGADEVKNIFNRLNDLAVRGIKFDLDIFTDHYSDNVSLDFKILEKDSYVNSTHHSKISLFKLDNQFDGENMREYYKLLDAIETVIAIDDKAQFEQNGGDEKWQSAS